MEMEKIGHYLFAFGALVAVVNGVLPGVVPSVGLILLLIGLLVGFLNVTTQETHNFLLAAVALLVANTVAGMNQVPVLGPWVAAILWGFATMAAPAAVIVAFKAFWGMAKD